MATIDESTNRAMGASGIDDMITLPNMTEESMLKNLQVRYAKDIIYTYTGTILVSVNPFQVLPIYSPDIVKRYVGQMIGKLPPHIFAIADTAFRLMREEQRNQSVIISGESGAGKTEATKLILQYLAAMTAKHSEVEQAILESSPVMEAFGNAKTVRNNNSSRFGKFIEVNFNGGGAICGAKMQQFLLEKSRITFQAPNERNYHIFYQLCAGATAEERKRMFLDDATKFWYTNQGGDPSIQGVEDGEDLDRVKTAMGLLGMSGQVQVSIFNMVAAVLHTGNINFKSDGKDGSVVANRNELDITAKLLQVEATALEKALTVRVNKIRGESIVVPLNPAQAVNTRDALAKALYSRLFEWLVSTINLAIDKSRGNSKNFIGVLDIFGFENFKVNSFEQLCINFANEKLQQHFNQTIFKLEQDEYDREKINWSKIQFNDNQETIDLIEKLRPPGIIAILDEETKFPKATDLTFLEKCHSNFGKHDSYEKPKLSKTTFIVKHYAGAVSYEVKDFLEKNKDTLREDLLVVLSKSSSTLVVELFKDVAAEGDEKAKKVPTVGTNFKNSLVSLMTTLNATHPHYIRCIKPNSLKIPSTFDADMVLAQLRYAGMLETIRIRRLGYPIRYPFNDFFRRYNVINPFVKASSNMSNAISEIMKKAQSLKQGDWQIGVTKVFLREKQYQALEEERNQKIMGSVIKIQSWWRMASTRKYYLYVRQQAIRIQARWKCYHGRRQFLRMQNGAILVQAMFRMYRLRKKYKPIIKQRREEAKRRAIEEKRRAEEAAREAARRAAAPPAVATSAAAEENSAGDGDLKQMMDGGDAPGNLSPRGTQMPRGSMRKSVIGAAPRVQTMRLPQGITPEASELRYDASKDLAAGTMTLKRKQIKFLTVIPEPKPIILPQEAKQYRFLDYASKNFQRHTEKGLFKKDKVLSFEEMITASKKIDAPLHNSVRTPEQIKLAVEIFSRANSYIDMGSKVGWDHAQFILGRGLQLEDLRDEIYCQMMKLTIGVSKRDQLMKGWELLCLVAGTFPPSDALVKYAAAHMLDTISGGDPKDELTQMAQFTYRRLQRVVELPKRFMVPGIAEIAAVRERKPIVCRFDFLDGNKKAMYIDSQTTSKEVFGILAEKIGLKDPVGYAIYECYNNLERSLNENDNLSDALAKFERFENDCKAKNIKVTFRFLFKRKLYLDPRQMSSDSVENSLMFYQAMYEIFSGRLPCRESEAVRFGALKLQIEFGDGVTNLNAADQLPQYVPRTLWTHKTPDEWRAELRAEQAKYTGKSKEECKFLFLREAKKLEFYGDTIFTVSHKSEWSVPAKFDLAVGKLGVHFLSESRQRAYSFTLDQVDNMYYTPKTMKLFFVTDAGVQKNIELQTLQGIEVASLIAEYQYWLDQESQWCRATQDYVNNDYSLLSFQAGDLIFVMNKDESGWWTGECNGKQGIFPCDHVQVLLTPPERPKSSAPTSGSRRGGPSQAGDPLLTNSRLSTARASVRGSAYGTSKSGRVLRDTSTAGEQQNFTTQQFSLVKFAEQFFRKSELKKSTGLGGTLSRNPGKQTPIELTQRLSFSREPISESLLEIENSLVSRAAVEVFNQILRYMGDDSAKKSRFRYAQTVVTGGLNAEELRNEVYCQLMKQTTNCPKADMCARGWELIVLCLACFLPTKAFLPYLIAYINDHRSAPGDIGRLAKQALERQQRTNMRGQRKRAPSTEEISQLLSGGQVVVRVFLLDGNAKACYIDSATIVAEIFSDIKSQLGVAALDGWSFYEVAPAIEYERPLKESDNVCDLMAAWELYEKPKNVTKEVLFSLLFKKKIFLEPRRDDPADPVLGPLVYAQAVDNVIRGRYPVTQEEAILLGALQLQAQYGDQSGNRSVLSDSSISQYIPAPLLNQRMNSDWIKQLTAAYGKMAGKQQQAARRLYVEKMMEWPLYGSTVFFCKQKQAPLDISIALNAQGIHILERGQKNAIKSYPYTQISNWSPAENAFTIIVGSLVKPLRYVFETGEAAHMSELFQSYVDALVMMRSEEKKKTLPNSGTRGKFF